MGRKNRGHAATLSKPFLITSRGTDKLTFLSIQIPFSVALLR